MCSPKKTSPTPLLSPNNKTRFSCLTAKKIVQHDYDEEDEQKLHRWPTPTEVVEEIKSIGKISGPTTLTGLILYSRAMISMLFLGHLGELELAGGSLSIGFANITGYSIISGLAMGMEPICGQAHGARNPKLLTLALLRTILLLLLTSIPISITWLHMKPILLWCGQDESISTVAQTFTLFSIPDLFLLSVIHPVRIFLRTQEITLPLTYCTAFSVLLHVPLSFLLVVYFKMGVAGVALAMVWTNLNLCLFLCSYIYFSSSKYKLYENPESCSSTTTTTTTTTTFTLLDCLKGWSSLLSLAIPTCISVCLEWWWYELMILLCGLLPNPKSTVASMGILIQTTALIYVFPSSLSLGVSTRVGNELGAGRPGRARISALVSVGSAFLLGACALCFTTSMRHQWGRMFTSDEEILKLTAAALPVVGLCEIGNCPQTTGCGVVRGSARPSVGANINLGSFYLVGMPVAIVFGFCLKFGFVGLWFGLLAAQGSCAAMILAVVSRTDWKEQVQRAKELTGSSGSTMGLPVSKTSAPEFDEKVNVVVVVVDDDEEDDGGVKKNVVEKVVSVEVEDGKPGSLEDRPLLV